MQFIDKTNGSRKTESGEFVDSMVPLLDFLSALLFMPFSCYTTDPTIKYSSPVLAYIKSESSIQA